MQKVIPIKLDERTLPEQQPTEQVMEVQCLICAQGRELFQVGECRHRCCLECYIEAVEEQLRLRNEGGCFQCSNPLLQTPDPNYVYIHLPERLKQKLATLSQILPSRCQMCDGTKCTCLPEGPPCEDVKQCIKCRAWIEKKKGCSHVKCQCGVEFCFQCEQEWSHAHICPHRIPSRQGIMYFVCVLVKVFLGLLIFPFLLVIFLFVACCICSISAAMLGFMTFIRLLEKTGKVEINDCAKLLLVLMLFVFMPVFSAVLFVPGFLLPVVNLCWHQTIFFNHAILGDWFYRLFSCLIILQVL